MAMANSTTDNEFGDIFDDEDDFHANFDILGTGNNRFEFYSDEDVLKFIENQENVNTKKKTANDIKLFENFLLKLSERRPIQDIPPEELSPLLSRFLLSVRKKDGSNYEPSSLRGFYSSIDRHLRQHLYQHSLVSYHKFATCRQALKSKQKQLKSEGKGNKPRASEELTDADIEHLYETGQLGRDTPQQLVNSLWLINMLHFGMRGGVEQKNLKWGDVKLETDDEGRRYLVYTQERQTKTRTGENPRDMRRVKPRAYETPENPERDPVAVYL